MKNINIAQQQQQISVWLGELCSFLTQSEMIEFFYFKLTSVGMIDEPDFESGTLFGVKVRTLLGQQ